VGDKEKEMGNPFIFSLSTKKLIKKGVDIENNVYICSVKHPSP